MRADIETIVNNWDKKERRILKNKACAEALSVVDESLPADESIIELAFNRHTDTPGVFVLTGNRLLLVGQSVQVWNFSDIDKVTSNGKDAVAIHSGGQSQSWMITNGRAFIPALTTVVNRHKFNPI